MLDGTDLLWTSNIRLEVSLKCSMPKGMMLEERKSGIACSLNFAKFIRRTTLFCNSKIFLRCDLAAWPQAERP